MKTYVKTEKEKEKKNRFIQKKVTWISVSCDTTNFLWIALFTKVKSLSLM